MPETAAAESGLDRSSETDLMVSQPLASDKWQTAPPQYNICCSETITVGLEWLEHLWNHENIFETGVIRANEC